MSALLIMIAILMVFAMMALVNVKLLGIQNLTVQVIYSSTTVGGPWYFDFVVFQRLINQSFYQEILLLPKFNDISGKVLKPKKSTSNLKKKLRPFFIFLNWDFDLDFSSFGIKKIQPLTSKKKLRPFFIFSFF